MRKRTSYNLFDLVGDLGGVFELLLTTGGVFLMHVSQHSFTLSAIKKLYLVKSTDSQLFDHRHSFLKVHKAETPLKGIQKYLHVRVTNLVKDKALAQSVLSRHRTINLSTKQECKLYFTRLYNFFFGRCCSSKTRLTVLFDEGERRIEKSLDIVKITKDIKYLKMLTTFKIDPDIETKF